MNESTGWERWLGWRYALICVLFTGLIIFCAVGVPLYSDLNFARMTPAEHLAAAKSGYFDSAEGRREIMRHLDKIPASSPEAVGAKELVLKVRVEQEKSDQEYAAIEHAAEARRQAASMRSSGVEQLGQQLKELGYEITVEASSEAKDEIVLTSSDFSDTDHRIRFLAFMRGRNAPVSAVCAAGFTSVLLRSSSIPYVGFDESYMLNCF